MSLYVTSDLHGYPLTSFRKLLQHVNFTDDDTLYVLGDVIDRNGDGGIDTLLWIMDQPNVVFILGNHEAMLLSCEFLFTEITDESLDALTDKQVHILMTWIRNGAEPTMKAIGTLSTNTRNDIFDYLRDAPLYDMVEVDERVFFLVHAGLGSFSAEKKLSEYSAHDFLWHRPSPKERYWDNVTVVLGHTPTQAYGMRGQAFVTDTWIDIDTGAGNGGHPMLLRLNDMKEFYMDEK